MTYKQLTNIFQNIADNHLQLKNIYFTKPFNIEDGEKEFPILFCNINSVSFPKSNSHSFQFQDMEINLKIYDLVNKENDNEIDVFSDTAQILADFITMLSEHPDFNNICFIVNSPILTPIYQQLDSNANGFETILTIRSMYSTKYCGLPIK